VSEPAADGSAALPGGKGLFRQFPQTRSCGGTRRLRSDHGAGFRVEALHHVTPTDIKSVTRFHLHGQVRYPV
jgi:hypothetical protein